MFKRILVAVDGSQTGELALQMAISLTETWPAGLTTFVSPEIMQGYIVREAVCADLQPAGGRLHR